MNNINEIKEMLDKLNEELEGLRAENRKLKLRLERYETVEQSNSSNNELSLDKVWTSIYVVEGISKDCMTRTYNAFFRAGFKQIKKLEGKNIYD